MKNIKFKKIVLFCMLFACPFAAMADDIDGGNGDGDVQDVPGAPIDDYIPLAFVAAIALSYKLVQKNTVKN
jgi:hypothetical protein